MNLLELFDSLILGYVCLLFGCLFICIYFLKEINNFIQQGCVKLMKSISKDLVSQVPKNCKHHNCIYHW